MTISEIDSKWLDNYFEDRPQLKAPPKGMFGYKIDRRWFDVINSLLNIASQHPIEQTGPKCDCIRGKSQSTIGCPVHGVTL